jgi:hypothetical protein
MQIEHARQHKTSGGVYFASAFADRLGLDRRDSVLLDDDIDGAFMVAKCSVANYDIHPDTIFVFAVRPSSSF